MQSPEERHKLEEQFHQLVFTALEERWKRDGRYSAKEILADIRSDEGVWKGMMEQLAEQAAVMAIRRQMSKREPEIDPAQERFAFAKELPVWSITFKGSIVSTLRSTADEFIWFSKWYERRHTGTLRRSESDEKTLAKIRRLARIVEKYSGENANETMEAIFKARQEKLDALRE